MCNVRKNNSKFAVAFIHPHNNSSNLLSKNPFLYLFSTNLSKLIMLNVKKLCRITVIDNLLGQLVTSVGRQSKVDSANVNYGRIANFTFIVAQCALEWLYLKVKKLVALDEGVCCEGLLTALKVADKLSRDNLVLRMGNVRAKVLNHHLTVARSHATVTTVVAHKAAHLMGQIEVISKVRV